MKEHDGCVNCIYGNLDENVFPCSDCKQSVLTCDPKWETAKDYWRNDNILASLVENKTDQVNHPSHYTYGRFECIDVLDEVTKDLTGHEAAYTWQVLKYMWRWKHKNGLEDLKKAQFYLNRLIEKVEGVVADV